MRHNSGVRPAGRLLTHCCWLPQQLTDMRQEHGTAPPYLRSTASAGPAEAPAGRPLLCATHTCTHSDTQLTLTSGSARSLLNFFTRICDDTLLCETSSSPGAAPPPPLPAAIFPAAWLLLSDLLLEAALFPAASPSAPCSCSWLRPDSTESACCSRFDGGLCSTRAAGSSRVSVGTSLQPTHRR